MDLTISNIGVLTAVAAGAVSFLSPCVLPLVPGYVSFIAGQAGSPETGGRRLPTAFLAVCFVLGFTTVFVALGASATQIGRLLRFYSTEANILGGALVVFFGVVTTGLLRLPFLERDLRYHGSLAGTGPISAYLLGLAFAFGWTPCIGPILGAILTLGAVSSTVGDGVALLALYSLGLGIPFLLSALFTQGLLHRLATMRRAGRILKIASGLVMILMGVAMMTGQFTWIAFWLLERFPAFGRIG